VSAAFTPGPWRTGRQRKIYAEGDELPVGQAIAKEREFAEATANARLIAAAPELFEALSDSRAAIASLAEDTFGEVILEYDDNGYPVCGYPVRDELLAKIDAALAKARGEQ
jgi:hypothetical protein